MTSLFFFFFWSGQSNPHFSFFSLNVLHEVTEPHGRQLGNNELLRRKVRSPLLLAHSTKWKWVEERRMLLPEIGTEVELGCT